MQKGLEKEEVQELGQETYFSKVLYLLLDRPMSRKEIAIAFNLKSISGHLNRVVFELRDKNLIEMTIPEKPRSSQQQYKLASARASPCYLFAYSRICLFANLRICGFADLPIKKDPSTPLRSTQEDRKVDKKEEKK